MRLAVASGLALWAGATLMVSQLRWFARPSLLERLRPYGPGGMTPRGRGLLPSVESFREVVGPLCRVSGERVARALGVSEDLSTRLERIHSPLDSTAFRVRQLGWTATAFAGGAVLSIALRPPPFIALLAMFGGASLVFLVVEERMARASDAWKRRLFLELPVMSEQLAMLLSAGFSLGSALNRLAERGRGYAARDLARVCGRIRQGLSEIDALGSGRPSRMWPRSTASSPSWPSIVRPATSAASSRRRPGPSVAMSSGSWWRRPSVAASRCGCP
ncbi:MAG: type II secretion system F family protein [Actinomycetota bacterium]|nr:type II secretion system F family protein [Actinomycetota bacterium]